MKTKEYGELSLREIGIMGIVKQMVKEDILELIDEFIKLQKIKIKD